MIDGLVSAAASLRSRCVGTQIGALAFGGNVDLEPCDGDHGNVLGRIEKLAYIDRGDEFPDAEQPRRIRTIAHPHDDALAGDGRHCPASMREQHG